MSMTTDYSKSITSAAAWKRMYDMVTERTPPMRIIELHAKDLVTAMDFVVAMKKAIGAPEWHGDSVDAFLDSMIYHDDINVLEAPYTIRVIGAPGRGRKRRMRCACLRR